MIGFQKLPSGEGARSRGKTKAILTGSKRIIHTLMKSEWWLVYATALLIGINRAGEIHESDAFWQIRAGLEQLSGTPLIRPDSWGWAPTGGLFYPNSPGWNLILALSWKAGKYWGLFLIVLISILASIAVLVACARYLKVGPKATMFALSLFTLLSIQMFSARGMTFAHSWLLLAVLAALWWSEKAKSVSYSLNAIVVTASAFGFGFIGNWIHISWYFYTPLIAFVWIVLWVLAPDISRNLKVALSIFGTSGFLLGIIFSPYGLSTIARSREVSAVCKGLIIEWISPFADMTLMRHWGITIAVGVLFFVATLKWLTGQYKHSGYFTEQMRLVVGISLVAFPFLILGSWAIRFVVTASYLLIPVAALISSEQFRKLRNASDSGLHIGIWKSARIREYAGEKIWKNTIPILIAVLAVLDVPYALEHSVPTSRNAISALPLSCNLFSDQEIQDTTLLLRPDVKVWFDGRIDYHGRRKIEELHNYFFKPSNSDPVPVGATCVLLRIGAGELPQENVAKILDASPDWQLIYNNSNFRIWSPLKP